MSIVIDDPSLERLAQELAAAEGTTVESVARESLMSHAVRRGFRPRMGQLPKSLSPSGAHLVCVRQFG